MPNRNTRPKSKKSTRVAKSPKTRIEPTRNPSDDLSKPLLFRYFDGGRERIGDMTALFRKVCYYERLPLIDDEFWNRLARFDEPHTSEAIPAIAEIFGMRRLDDATGLGLTDEQIAETFLRFIRELLDAKKAPGGGLIILPAKFITHYQSKIQQATQSESTPVDSGLESCSTPIESPAGDTPRSLSPSATRLEVGLNRRGSTPSAAVKNRRRSPTTTISHPGPTEPLADQRPNSRITLDE